MNVIVGDGKTVGDIVEEAGSFCYETVGEKKNTEPWTRFTRELQKLNSFASEEKNLESTSAKYEVIMAAGFVGCISFALAGLILSTFNSCFLLLLIGLLPASGIAGWAVNKIEPYTTLTVLVRQLFNTQKQLKEEMKKESGQAVLATYKSIEAPSALLYKKGYSLTQSSEPSAPPLLEMPGDQSA